MKKKNYKGQCQKRCLGKCEGVCRTYDEIQYAYADRLQENPEVTSFLCNVELDVLPMGAYTSDFLVTLENGDRFVRECVRRELLTKPLTVTLLDASREYWLKHGIRDWGVVTNEKKD